MGMVAQALLLAASPVLAQEQNLSLQQTIAIALQQNRLLLAEHAGIESTLAGLREAGGRLLPRISVSSSASRSNSPMASFGGKLLQQRFTSADFAIANLNNPAYLSNYQHRLTLEAPLYQGGRLWAAKKRAGYELDAGYRQFEANRQQIIFAVVQAYSNVLRLESRETAAASAHEAAKRHLKQTQSLFSRGISIESDVLDARAHVSDARLGLLKTRHARISAMDELHRLLGDPKTTIRPQGAPHIVLQNLTEEKQNIEQHPILLALQQQLGAAQASIDESAAPLRPHIGLVATQEWNNSSLAPRHPNSTIAAEVSLNLFAGGADLAARDAARARQARMQYQMQDERLRLQNELARAWRSVHESEAASKAHQASLLQARESLRILRLRFARGLEKTTDVLDAQTRADQAAANEIDARFNLIVNRAAVLLAAGKLIPEALDASH